MGTYRKEWDCCGSVTETEAWEPESCPFCTAAPNVAAQAGDEPMPWNRRYDLGASVEAAMLAEIRDWRAYAAQVSPRATADVERDAARYRWLCDNNFDKEGVTQIHTLIKTWEPHSQTGEPQLWSQRVRGGPLDAAIDEIIATTKPGA